MLAFAIRRLIQAIGVMLVVAMISFVMFRFVGDPVSQLVGNDTPPEQRALLRKELGLDDPIYVQFARFVDKAVHFDFGISYQIKQPVSQLIAQRLPATLELSIVSAILALMIGMPIFGYCTGVRSEGRLCKEVHLNLAYRSFCRLDLGGDEPDHSLFSTSATAGCVRAICCEICSR